MLPKNRRLSRKEVQFLFHFGKKTNSKDFLILSHPSKSGNARVAILTPMHAFKLATQRNAIRRLLYQSIVKYIDRLPALDIGILLHHQPNISEISSALNNLK